MSAPRARAHLERLRSRAPYRFPEHAVPAHFRRAAVLVPFWAEPAALRVLLTRRASRMSRHAGQVAFPGGMLESGETHEQAALREAHEEVGIDPALVEVLGRLDDAWSGAGSHIVPVVAWLRARPRLEANPAEVDEILVADVADLLKPASRSEERVLRDGVEYVNPIVEWPGGRAYGLSADLLLEALAWVSGGTPERGPARLRDLDSWKARARLSPV